MYDVHYFLNGGWRAIPTQSNNPKYVVKGYTHADKCKVEDFNNGRGIKLVTGLQFNGYHLIGIDDDIGGKSILQAAQEVPELYKRLVIARSTTGQGLHAFFYTDTEIKSGTCHNGKVEIKADNGKPLNAPCLDRLVQGNEGFQPFTLDEAYQLLAAIGYTTPQVTPQVVHSPSYSQVQASRNDGYMADPIAHYNSKTDIHQLLQEFGAIRAGQNYHCGCGNHPNGDKNPSLSIMASRKSRNGAYVVKGHSPVCKYYGIHHAFDLYRIHYNLDTADALKQLYPDNLLINQTTQESAQPEPEPENTSTATPETIDVSPDALRQRRKRAAERDVVVAELRQRIEQDKSLKPRARLVAGALLAKGKLQSKLTNNEIAQHIGCSKRLVQMAIRELENAGYGKRHGGVNFTNEYRRATWNWTPYRVQEPDTSLATLHPIDLKTIKETKGTREKENAKQLEPRGVIEEQTSLSTVIDAAFTLARAINRRVSFPFVLGFVRDYGTNEHTDNEVKEQYKRILEKNRQERQNTRTGESKITFSSPLFPSSDGTKAINGHSLGCKDDEITTDVSECLVPPTAQAVVGVQPQEYPPLHSLVQAYYFTNRGKITRETTTGKHKRKRKENESDKTITSLYSRKNSVGIDTETGVIGRRTLGSCIAYVEMKAPGVYTPAQIEREYQAAKREDSPFEQARREYREASDDKLRKIERRHTRNAIRYASEGREGFYCALLEILHEEQERREARRADTPATQSEETKQLEPIAQPETSTQTEIAQYKFNLSVFQGYIESNNIKGAMVHCANHRVKYDEALGMIKAKTA